MPTIAVNEAFCKGCGLCVAACPKKVLELDRTTLNHKGYHPARLVKPEGCTGCTMCAVMCPDCAIIVER